MCRSARDADYIATLQIETETKTKTKAKGQSKTKKEESDILTDRKATGGRGMVVPRCAVQPIREGGSRAAAQN